MNILDLTSWLLMGVLDLPTELKRLTFIPSEQLSVSPVVLSTPSLSFLSGGVRRRRAVSIFSGRSSPRRHSGLRLAGTESHTLQPPFARFWRQFTATRASQARSDVVVCF